MKQLTTEQVKVPLNQELQQLNCSPLKGELSCKYKLSQVHIALTSCMEPACKMVVVHD